MLEPTAHIHAIGTAVPEHDFHAAFVGWANGQLPDRRARALFARMAARSGIEHRWTVLPRATDGGSPAEPGGFYHGNRLPTTARRMEVYAEEAPKLALAAIDRLREQAEVDQTTHLVVASCTGFVAPGLDQLIVRELRLNPGIERTIVGFMGCYAAVAALRVAHHIARSDKNARVLVVTVELSSLHLRHQSDVESLLAALQFGDGAAAAMVSAEPGGLAMTRFFSAELPDSAELIQWVIGDEGFEMTLSGEVPHRIGDALRRQELRALLLQGQSADDLAWAVHPGGRSILDAVAHGLDLDQDALAASRSVLARFGNMSSSTLMFVLRDMMAAPTKQRGVAMAFGPGLATEGFDFAAA